MPTFQLIHKHDYDGDWYHIKKNDETVKSIKDDHTEETLHRAYSEYERIRDFQVVTTVLREDKFN